MTTATTFGHKLAALALTVMVSATMVLSAIGPATAVAQGPTPIARATA